MAVIVRYRGERSAYGCEVWRETVEAGAVYLRSADAHERRHLDARRDLVNHSPTGFEWGYAGSGPAQLALAILTDAVRTQHPGAEAWADEFSLRWYQRFKDDVVAMLDRGMVLEDYWIIPHRQVIDWVHETAGPTRENVL